MSSNLPQPRTSASLLGPTYVGPFDDWTVKHDFYGRVMDYLIHRLEWITQPSIFVIMGPAGIGKTTMVRHLELELIKIKQPEMAMDPSVIPYLHGEASFTPGVGMDWRTLFADLLASGNEFLIDAKVESSADKPGATLPALRRAVKNMMLHRRPALAIVDEASELTENGIRGGLAKNANYLKSLGNLSRTHFAFFGDYRLAALADVSGQLNRRCYWVHLPPYPSSHFPSFEQAVIAFEKRGREFGIEIYLKPSARMLFAATCGCVGLLHRWIGEAMIEAKLNKVPINHLLLQQTAFSNHQVALWRREITDGQNKIAAITKRTGRVFTP